ncbi:SIMPL domain-containing protein [Thalassomonas actiniarum]|uniref:SIMPL domain-containing protein n=1 Tax=Thalassomonas actiniarum TaxID=485447 RepID=A0AAF0C0S4_9GAMM|nr:SIMPL domain-containing protein [Thalassomonas actiniarum]WDD96997.1 SIMPL domain-containing protein [Thalassomonas actiniarum]
MRLLILSACCLILLPSWAEEHEREFQRENIIEVIGDGVIAPNSDRMKMNLVLKEESRHISKAKMLIEQQSRQIKQIAAGLEIAEANIHWQQLNIRPIYKEDAVQVQALEVPHTLYQGQEAQVFVSAAAGSKNSGLEKFELSRELSINFSDHGLYQQFLQRALSHGIKHFFPSPINPDEYHQYYQQALDKAVVNAKTKAGHLARQTGTKLGALFSLKEVILPDSIRGQGHPLLKGSAASDHPGQEIRARVIVSFRIIP